jgi:hypothetical protein
MNVPAPVRSSFLALTFLSLSGCGIVGAISAPGIDCGTSDDRASYDAAARDCIWGAYTSGKTAHWTVKLYTIEGDAIPGLLSIDQGQIVVTRDMTADRYSNADARRRWTWRCREMTKKPLETNPSRMSFILRDCSGDGSGVVFP